MVKADEYCTYVEDEKNKKHKYTEFELLEGKVNRLIDEVVLIGKILKQTGLKLTEKTEAVTDDFDLMTGVFEELGEE